MLLPSTAARAVGSVEGRCCFYFQRQIKSHLGRAASSCRRHRTVTASRTAFPSPFIPGEPGRGGVGAGCRGARRDAQGCPGCAVVPSPRAPPRLPSRAAEEPHCHLVPPEHQDSREAPPLGAGGPGLLALAPGAPLAAVNLSLLCQNPARHGQPCHSSCFVPPTPKGLRKVQIALLKSKTLQLLTRSS